MKNLTDDSRNKKGEREKKSLRRPRFELGLPRPQRGVLTTILTPLSHDEVGQPEIELSQHTLKAIHFAAKKTIELRFAIERLSRGH